jgi:hypothetical protein
MCNDSDACVDWLALGSLKVYDGDCDYDLECKGSLICGDDNCS